MATVFVLSAPAVVLTVQLIATLLVSFPDRGSGIGAALAVLLGGLLAPHLKLAGACGRWWLPGALSAAGLARFLVAGAKGFDASHPRPDTLSYGLDVDANRAYWLSSDRTPDSYTSRFSGRHASARSAPAVLSRAVERDAAGACAFEGSEPPRPVELTASKPEGDLRIVRLSVRPQRPVSVLYLYLDPDAELSIVSVDGGPLEPVPARRGAGSRPVLAFGGLPKEGAVVQLWLRGGVSPLRVLVIDWAYGVESAPRPAGFMPHPFNSDMTLVSKTYEFK